MSGPRAESGIVFLGPWGEEQERMINDFFGGGQVESLGEALTRIGLSDPRAGYEATGLLMRLSLSIPEAAVIGFFCDADTQSEGVRVFQAGREDDRREVEWATADPPDPMVWPIGSMGLTFQLPAERFTAVPRPERPPLAQAMEALVVGEDVSDLETLRQALELLGQLPVPEATAVLTRHLKHEDWVVRFHAAKGYTRFDRGPGAEERPRLETLLDDEDEGVREAAIAGLLDLIPEVEHSSKDLIAQIDATLERGLKDEDEDVREVAEQAAELRARLLG
jgi:hypothetical protein